MNPEENQKLVGPSACGRGGNGINLPVRQVVEKSAEKPVVVKEEGSTSSLPERVLIFLLGSLVCCWYNGMIIFKCLVVVG